MTLPQQLWTLLSKKAQKSILFGKHKMYKFGNKPSKYLANLIKGHAGFQAIPVVKNSAGARVHSNKHINN